MCDVRVFNYVRTLSVVHFVANQVHVCFLFFSFRFYLLLFMVNKDFEK